jgi:hypothetical protein
MSPVLVYSQNLEADYSACFKNCAQKDTDAVVLEWINIDIKHINTIFNKTKENGATVRDLEALYKSIGSERTNSTTVIHDLGEGLTLMQYKLYGGYGSTNYHILHTNGNVLRINQYISNKTEFIETYLLEEIKEPIICKYGYPEQEIYYPQHVAAYKKTHPHFYLDQLSAMETDSADSEIINFFGDYAAARNLNLGTKHVYDRYWPIALNHINALIAQKRIELLKQMLYSVQPLGRIFAASALHYLSKNKSFITDAETETRISKIKQSGTVITSGILSCWTNNFEYGKYDIYVDFEQFIAEGVPERRKRLNVTFGTIDQTDSSAYQITKIDSINGSIQRLFIVIDSTKVHDFELIEEIILAVDQDYNIAPKTHLSFFCDEKYADYKDELFLGDQSEFTIEDYRKWKNYYYLGEFDYETNEYLSYPANSAGLAKSRSRYITNCCPE